MGQHAFLRPSCVERFGGVPVFGTLYQGGAGRDGRRHADNARNCIVAYDIVRPDENVSDPDRYRGNLLAEQQLQKGGFRLAHVLNSIFGR